MSAPFLSTLDAQRFTPSQQFAEYHYADNRASRALRGTLTGESMADWGPHYVKEAQAVFALGSVRGTLWERVAG